MYCSRAYCLFLNSVAKRGRCLQLEGLLWNQSVLNVFLGSSANTLTAPGIAFSLAISKFVFCACFAGIPLLKFLGNAWVISLSYFMLQTGWGAMFEKMAVLCECECSSLHVLAITKASLRCDLLYCVCMALPGERSFSLFLLHWVQVSEVTNCWETVFATSNALFIVL